MIHMQQEWCRSQYSPVIPSGARNLGFVYTTTDAVWYSSYDPLKSVIL